MKQRVISKSAEGLAERRAHIHTRTLWIGETVCRVCGGRASTTASPRYVRSSSSRVSSVAPASLSLVVNARSRSVPYRSRKVYMSSWPSIGF